MNTLLPFLVLSFFLLSCENPVTEIREMKKGNEDLRAQAKEAAVEIETLEEKLDEVRLAQMERQTLETLFEQIKPVYDELNQNRKTLLGLGRKSRLEKMSPLNLEGKKKESERIFYNFSASLPEQVLTRQGCDALETIIGALQKHGERLSLAEKLVVSPAYRGLAVELLRARLNFMAALAIEELSTTEELSLKEKSAGILFKVSGGLVGGLHADSRFNSVNIPTKKGILFKMQAAVEAKKALEEIGEEPRLHKSVLSLFNHLDLDSPTLKAMESHNDQTTGESATRRFIELYDQLMSQMY